MVMDSAFIKTEEAENASYIHEAVHQNPPHVAIVGGTTVEEIHQVVSADPIVTHVSHVNTFISNPEDLNPTYLKQEGEIKTELYDM